MFFLDYDRELIIDKLTGLLRAAVNYKVRISKVRRFKAILKAHDIVIVEQPLRVKGGCIVVLIESDLDGVVADRVNS